MTMGASRTTKLLGMDLDPRLTLNVAASKQCAATSQRISQLRCIAHKEAGPSPHDLYVRHWIWCFQITYGSELIWAVATDSAKNEMQKTYATLARIVSGVPSTVDPESALLEANMPPSTSFACARGSPYLRTHAHVRWTGCEDLRLSHRLAQVSASRHYLGTSYMPS
ncbi:putative Reverse transcriptase (RNA-dependent DNA polymerase)/RNase H [Trypanosoma cruzi]|nr:putative Reverse transcriptase (RNA-dependent DNA polymerase)/RNase H [Trypanosoma cruzi]